MSEAKRIEQNACRVSILAGALAASRRVVLALFFGFFAAWPGSIWAHPDHSGGKGDPANRPPLGGGGVATSAMGATACNPTTHRAGPYPCNKINLYSFLPLSDVGAVGDELANDIWGWTDSTTGREYALLGREGGTSFVDVTDPIAPVYLGNLPTRTNSSTWRDIKVHNNHAFIVADGAGNHGIQVFDLTQLRTATPGSTFAAGAHYNGFANAHNIAINEDTGYAYAVGTNTFSGGLHIVNIQNPMFPTFAGSFVASTTESSERYSHDTQVVTYHGPDPDFQGHEIAFSSNQKVVSIADVTSKASPVQLALVGYRNSNYTHQGWLTEDHRYFLTNDELDERIDPNVNFTRTHIWDVADLNNPVHLGFYAGRRPSIDHNLYTYGDLVFESNYRSGLRILDLGDIRNADLNEVGYFDVYPDDDAVGFNGAWSAYRFPGSGTTIVSGIESGLYVLDTSAISSAGPTMGIVNGSFESVKHHTLNYDVVDGGHALFRGDAFDPNLPDRIEDITIPGWVGPELRALIINPTDAEFLEITTSEAGDGMFDGENVLFLRSGNEVVTVRTTLADVLEADMLYTLSLAVGQSLSHSINAGYDISLLADGQILGQLTDAGGPAIPHGSFTTVEVEVDSRNFPDLLGTPLEVHISTSVLGIFPGDGVTMFDNVSLAATGLDTGISGSAIPEPGSFSLFALLAGGFFYKKRRGRRRRR